MAKKLLAEEEDEDFSHGVLYVSKKVLAGVKGKLKQNGGEEDLKRFMDKAMKSPEDLPDKEMLVPVDTRGAGKGYDSVKDMVSELGMVGGAEALVQARENFEAYKHIEQEDERPQPMTAKEWRRRFANDDSTTGTEEDFPLRSVTGIVSALLTGACM